MFEGIPVAALTPSALLGIFVLMLFFGKIVPRAILQDKIEECNNWRQTAEAEREARATSDAQTRELLELAKTTNKLVQDMFGAAARIRESGEANALPTVSE
jgi:hypothetical protein